MDERQFPDPLNDTITTSSFQNEIRALKEKALLLYAYPRLPLIFMFCAGVVSVTTLIYLFFIKAYIDGLLFFLFLPQLLFYFYIKSLEKDLLLQLLCERNQWVFNPKTHVSRANKLSKLFPEAFDRGHSPVVDDQIWGTLTEKDANAFWSGTFTYTTGEGRSSSTHEKYAFILELNKKLPSTFTLLRYGFDTENLSLSRLTMKRDLKTESEAFNKLFKIQSNEDSLSYEQKILTALSPSVQVRLIDFAEKFSLDCITFKHNCMIILFAHNPWEAKHTNFFKRVMIDERDVKHFHQLMKDMTALPSEMIRFLD